MYSSIEIAEKIKSTAKSKNLSIKDILFECGLSKNALSSMISGGSIPKSENLAKIADCLSVSVDYLLGRTDNPEIQQNSNNNATITGSNIVNGNVENSSNVNTIARTTTLDETAEQVLNAFQSMTLADKAKVITLIAELTEKNKTA